MKFGFALAAIMALGSGPAFAACNVVPGDTIFEDTFADDSGGWAVAGDAMNVVNGEMQFSLSGENTNWILFNNTFDASEGEFCAVFTQPRMVASDNIGAVGLLALKVDDQNYYLLQLGGDNRVTLWRLMANAWSLIGEYGRPDLLLGPGKEVMLRLSIRNGEITSYVNETRVGRVRIQMPAAPNAFGLYFQVDKAVPVAEQFVVKEYKVTTGGR